MKFPALIRKAFVGASCAVALTCGFSVAALSAPHDASGAATTSTSPKNTSTSTSHRKPVAHSSSKSSSGTTRRTSSKGKRSSAKRVRGQQKIDSDRAQSIQQALIREHYLSGEPTGTWNQASEDAMRKYQADHGWQSKTVPDSRALIKLGLGPSKDHLLNPESAMTTVPDAPRAQSLSPVSHSADPGAPAPQSPHAASPDASGPQ